jgi:NADH-quinone oxidoreductase subunit L
VLAYIPSYQDILLLASLIPALPLAATVIIALFGARMLKNASHVPAVAAVGGSFLLALALGWMFYTGRLPFMPGEIIDNYGNLLTGNIYQWMGIGSFQINVGVYLDPLASLFLLFVTGISLLIFIYSSGYMQGDYGYFRFFAYMSIFVFFMTTLVLANNFVLVYLGWEGVGLASYLLVGYYYPKPSARDAAVKAFMVNRIGDTCFAIAIFVIYLTFHSLNFSDIFYGLDLSSNHFRMEHQTALFWIPLLLMIGAFAKSAQFPLHVWLPDAMEGPTPVSALIHAATMVTAGVYLIARCMPLFINDIPVLHLVGIIGCFTAFMAATIGMCQYDIKRIFAYSTVSQLGYMFMGLGVAAGSTAVFHVFTHAFFKALLFLSAGSVMHAMGGELDIRKMSGLRKKMPITTICIFIGCLALAGFPGLSGFFSKDEILSAAMNSSWVYGPWLAVAGLITALITAYYTFRVFFRVFMGELTLPPTAGQHEPSVFVPAGDDHTEHLAGGEHDADHGKIGSLDGPVVMWMPLIILAIGAALVGLVGVFGGSGENSGLLQSFLSRVPALNGPQQYLTSAGLPLPAPSRELLSPTIMMSLGAIISIVGILIAAYFHWVNRHAATIVGIALRPVVKFLENKWYFDELYHYTLVRPLRILGHILSMMDRLVVDGIVFVIAFFPQFVGHLLKPSESGRLRYYGIGMIAGVVIIVLGVIYLMHGPAPTP